MTKWYRIGKEIGLEAESADHAFELFSAMDDICDDWDVVSETDYTINSTIDMLQYKGYFKMGDTQICNERVIRMINPATLSMISIHNEDYLDPEELWDILGVTEEDVKELISKELYNLDKPHNDDDITKAIDNEEEAYEYVIKSLVASRIANKRS